MARHRQRKIGPKTSRALLSGMQLTNVTARFSPPPGGKRRHSKPTKTTKTRRAPHPRAARPTAATLTVKQAQRLLKYGAL